MKSLINFLLYCCKPAVSEANPGEALPAEQSKAETVKETSLCEAQILEGKHEEEKRAVGKQEIRETKGKRGKLPTIRLVSPGQETAVVLFAVIPEVSASKKQHDRKKKRKRRAKNSASEPHRELYTIN